MEYLVKWEIDVEANSPREAAEQALAIQRNAQSLATVFEVNGTEIDLCEEEESQRQAPGSVLVDE